MSSGTKIRNWLRSRLESIPSAERFDLLSGSGDDEMSLLQFTREDRPLDDLCGERSEECWALAVGHAEAFESKQRFRLVAFLADGQAVATLVFAAGRGATGSAFSLRGDSGEVNEKGLLGQLMRHNQQLAQLNVEAMQAVLGPIISENQDLRRRIGEAESRRIEWFELHEQLAGQKNERDMMALEAANRSEFKSRIGKALADKWIPELISRIDLGRVKSLPPSTLGDVGEAQAMMRDVLGSVDRADLSRQLDGPEKVALDSLCGIGPAPDSMESFRRQLRAIWTALPESVSDDLVSQLSSRPDLAARISSLLETSETN